LRSWVRCFLIAFISCGMLNLQFGPASGAAEARPLAVVASADRAHLSAQLAETGATVFPGDSLDTDTGGELRLVIGKGQVYLLSDSAVNMSAQAGALEAAVLRGTVGFSMLTSRQFLLETAEGTIRAANGLPAHGQVTIRGPKELIVTAFEGNLLLERNDQKLMISAGQSYDVELVPNATPPVPGQGKQGVQAGYTDRLVWKIIVIGTAALVGYLLWHFYSESPIDPK
jgi:hypothetical protein